jgi:hypothetical protein
MTEKSAKDVLRAALEAKKAKQSQGKKNKKTNVNQGSMGGNSQDVVQPKVVRRSSRGG